MNRDILDDQGKPIPRQSTRTARLWDCVRRTWKIWVPIAISMLISVAALAISGLSYRQSAKDSEVTHRLSKLDFRPRLRLYSLLTPVGKIPPHWTLTNTGPVEAVHVQIKMISHRYIPGHIPNQKKMSMSMLDSTNTTTISSIQPQETKSYKFREGWLDSNARIQEPPQHNVMEILVTYRHPQDLEEYSESAYYFVNPGGFWVPEGSSSLKGELYESLRMRLSGVVREGPSSVYKEWPGDPMHTNK